VVLLFFVVYFELSVPVQAIAVEKTRLRNDLSVDRDVNVIARFSYILVM